MSHPSHPVRHTRPLVLSSLSLSLLLALPACMGPTPKTYKQETISTPNGTYQVAVGEGVLIPLGIDGKPLPNPPQPTFHLVAHEAVTPTGRVTVYTRQYDYPTSPPAPPTSQPEPPATTNP